MISTLMIIYMIWLLMSLTCAVVGEIYEIPFIGGFCLWTLPMMFYIPFFIL